MSKTEGSVVKAETLLFNAVLRPNRSLSKKGFYILMGFIAFVIFISSLGFFLAGAWPVLGFLGFDLALVFIAFRLSYRSGGQLEILRLTRDELQVTRVNPWGQKSSISFQPYWLGVSIEETEMENKLVLSSHGDVLCVGQFLAPEERKELAEELNSVLNQLKHNLI